MSSAAAYVLRVPENRRDVLLNYEGPSWAGFPISDEDTPVTVGEPVTYFNHSRRAPLVVFACFADDAITHVAEGRKGVSAGTGLVRLNMIGLEPVNPPVPFDELLSRVRPRLRAHLRRVLTESGKLPPRTLSAVVDILLGLRPDLGPRLARYSKRRAERISRMGERTLENLALQKESLATALKISGLRSDDLLEWTPSEEKSRSFLEGLPQVYTREDAALVSDFAELPGFDVIQNLHFAARTFQSTGNPSLRLKVIMANRLALEEQTGADLIYYNEAFQSFILVQYKTMTHEDERAVFRWRSGDQLAKEIERMTALLDEMRKLPSDARPASFRFNANPFFLKFCPRVLFNPDDKGLFKGMYLPLNLWHALAADDCTKGSRGGRLITFDNVGRWINNTDFLTLVSDAWIGTTIPQSRTLSRVIETVVSTGKTVTFAVKTNPSADRTGPDFLGDCREQIGDGCPQRSGKNRMGPWLDGWICRVPPDSEQSISKT